MLRLLVVSIIGLTAVIFFIAMNWQANQQYDKQMLSNLERVTNTTSGTVAKLQAYVLQATMNDAQSEENQRTMITLMGEIYQNQKQMNATLNSLR